MVTFQVYSEGKPLDYALQVVELEVYHNVSGVAQARIIFLAGEDVSALVDSSDLEANRQIEIKLGYDNNNQSIFKGAISSQNLYIKPEQGAGYEVICEGTHQAHPFALADLQKAKSSLKLVYGQDILTCSLNVDPSLGTQIMGDLHVFGSSQLTAGCVITLEGLGKRFAGNQFVAGVNHHVADGQWITSINIGLNEEESSLIEHDSSLETEITSEMDLVSDLSRIDDQEVIEIKDKNGNAITLSPSGISIESNLSLSIKAKGQLVINGAMVSIN